MKKKTRTAQNYMQGEQENFKMNPEQMQQIPLHAQLLEYAITPQLHLVHPAR